MGWLKKKKNPVKLSALKVQVVGEQEQKITVSGSDLNISKLIF